MEKEDKKKCHESNENIHSSFLKTKICKIPQLMRKTQYTVCILYLNVGWNHVDQKIEIRHVRIT